MITTLQELKEAVAGLPVDERAELAQFILHSLDDQPEETVRAEWLVLAAERMKQVRVGQVVGVPAEQVLNDLVRQRQ